jgi:hypothetical protein
MKKIILTTITLFLFAGYSVAGNVLVIKSDGSGLGGDKAYKYVTEEHSAEPGNNFHFLNCDEPGNSPCTWMYEPTVNGTSPTTIHYEIVTQLELGVLNGSLTFEGCIATWTSDSTGGYRIEIIYNN